jgi:hypothetical protein
MTTSTPTSGNTPASPTLSKCVTDSIVLQGLIQAFSEVDTIETKAARNGRGALLCVMEELADRLSTNLDRLNDEK